ncbi:CAAX prenyl protease 1, partial [Orchesella cincta]
RLQLLPVSRQRSVLIENRKILPSSLEKSPRNFPQPLGSTKRLSSTLRWFPVPIISIILYTVTYPILDAIRTPPRPPGDLARNLDYEMGESCVFITITVSSRTVSVPLQLYKTFVIEQKYGFNKMSLFTFFRENMEMMAMQSVWASVACCCILFIIRVTGYVFVVWVWLFCSFWLLMTLGIYPNVIAPIFNKYTPLRDGHMRDRLHKLARFIEFPLEDILVLHQKETKSTHRLPLSAPQHQADRPLRPLLQGYPEADLAEPKKKRDE